LVWDWRYDIDGLDFGLLGFTFILTMSSRLPVVCHGTGTTRFFFINLCKSGGEEADEASQQASCASWK